jgi:hypothetical protein
MFSSLLSFYLGNIVFLPSFMEMKTTSRNITALTIWEMPEFRFIISMIWLNSVMDSAPIDAE